MDTADTYAFCANYMRFTDRMATISTCEDMTSYIDDLLRTRNDVHTRKRDGTPVDWITYERDHSFTREKFTSLLMAAYRDHCIKKPDKCKCWI